MRQIEEKEKKADVIYLVEMEGEGKEERASIHAREKKQGRGGR